MTKQLENIKMISINWVPCLILMVLLDPIPKIPQDSNLGTCIDNMFLKKLNLRIQILIKLFLE